MPYHHGNLRSVLVEAALALIAEQGPRGFTLREVARRAGVSHNAPYRHFQSKEELLAAVAVEGFRDLRQAMLVEMSPRSSPGGRLHGCGLGYLRFALEHPQHFTVMFDLCLEDSSEYAAAGAQAYEVLRQAVREAQEAGHLPPGDLELWALHSWSLVHGLAKLALAGQLPLKTPQEVLEFGARMLSLGAK